MATPLFTAAELDTQIAAYKQALLDLAGGKSVRLNTGNSERQITSEDAPEIRKTLEWLQNEKLKLSGKSGPQFIPGRPKR